MDVKKYKKDCSRGAIMSDQAATKKATTEKATTKTTTAEKATTKKAIPKEGGPVWADMFSMDDMGGGMGEGMQRRADKAASPEGDHKKGEPTKKRDRQEVASSSTGMKAMKTTAKAKPKAKPKAMKAKKTKKWADDEVDEGLENYETLGDDEVDYVEAWLREKEEFENSIG